MDDARPKMCYSPSPPPTSKAIFSSNLTFDYKCSSENTNLHNTTSYHCQDYNSNYFARTKERDNMHRSECITNVNDAKPDEETTSDYKQWLHAMKLVARLPGGIPPEFRRKLWLSLADKYLKSKNVDWAKEEEKCFCEKWREDDEELGIQIVKDLHRTGSTLCTGPAGDLNQAKLKRILLGYARYNPEVGYCQGFNMLGALILQVMDKDESESIKVMIYLVEGILPTGYFCGSMGGLQADMAVFRELMQTKLPRLAKHLQKLQGPIENAYEPPLTNVFTMQWFLTMFCTCLPMSCVLRVWDLVLIEGSDVLLRTALALWSLLEERVLSARTADDFYGKMGSFSSELLNGHLIDSNGLIEKVVQLGPIQDIQKLRDKHLCNIAPIERQQGLQLYFDDDEPEIDDDSRLAVATVWGIPWGRRGSQGQPNNNVSKQAIENKDRIALDISLLKKQYDRLRERQRQAQIILTTACSSASRQSAATTPLPVNQLLSGRPAIVTNKGRRSGPPTGAIPPARKPSLPAVLHDKPSEKQLRRGDTLLWRDTRDTKIRRDSLSWREIKAERAAMISSGSIDGLKSQKIRSARLGKSDSSSYSEESDENENEAEENASSSDTSPGDEDLQAIANDKQLLSVESNKKSSIKAAHKSKRSTFKQRNQTVKEKNLVEKIRPKSWAPSNTEIPFVLMTADSPNHSADENPDSNSSKKEVDIINEKTQTNLNQIEVPKRKTTIYSPVSDEITISEMEPTSFVNFESPTPKDASVLNTTATSAESNEKDVNTSMFDISNEGVTNEYFERVNSTERPTKLELFYSLNEDENIRDVFKIDRTEQVKPREEKQIYASDKILNKSNNIRCMDLLVDYSEKSSAACIEEAKTEISSFKNENVLRKTKSSAEKRRDPRRLTLTRSSTMDIEKRFEAFEKRFSMDICTNYTRFSDEIESNLDNNRKPNQGYIMNFTNPNYISDPINNGSCSETVTKKKYIPPDKKIPSTADLEERFENIQQQLVRDRNRMSRSPCDSENAEKRRDSKSSQGNNETRSSPKDKCPRQPKRNDDSEEDSNKTEGDQVVTKHSDTRDKSQASRDFEDVNENSSAKDSKSDNMDISVSTASQTNQTSKKKEPPDENKKGDDTEDDCLDDEYANETKDIRNRSAIVLDESKDDFEKSAQRNTEVTNKKIKSNRASDRTSPPSTEELEKRFSALEEQLISARNESKTTAGETPCKSESVSEESAEADTKDLKEITQDSRKNEKDCSHTKAEHSTNLACADPKTSFMKSQVMTEKSPLRRLSEPPSTEDLERRYEILKRRMSSKNFETKTFHKDIPSHEIPGNSESAKKTASKISTSKQSPPSIENLEERYEKLQNKNESKNIAKAQSPPSTENLEERFEKLQHKIEKRDSIKSQSSTPTKNVDESFENIQTENQHTESKISHNAAKASTSSTNKENQKPNEKNADKPLGNDDMKEERTLSNNSTKGHAHNSDNEAVSSEQSNTDVTSPETQEQFDNTSEKKKPVDILSKNANKIKIKLIEELQAKIKVHSSDANVEKNLEKKMALIEELKTKIEPLPDKFLKPTQISSRRHPSSQNTLLQSKSFNDETLEPHATSANCRSGKHEPINAANRKMVRRFSDLPSRADLENRLQFLEEQLSKTVCMQRRASDSEVASKVHFNKKPALSGDHLTGNLEYRVQELEKRLKDNTTISMDVECLNVKEQNDPEIEVSQVDLSADSVAVTGKELVRYSSHGDAVDIEHPSPINISINIQMTLNKEDIGVKKTTEFCKSDDLVKRLQILEQQFKSSQAPDALQTLGDSSIDSSKANYTKEHMSMTHSAEENEQNKETNKLSPEGLSENTHNKIELNSEGVDAPEAAQSSPVPKATENIEQEKLSDTDPSTSNSSCHVPKAAENLENGKRLKESKNTESNSLHDTTSEKAENSSADTKENEKIAKIKSTENNNSVESHGLKTSQKETESKTGEENEISEIATKKNEIIEESKSSDNANTSSTQIKAAENNKKDDKNHTNSLQQKLQKQNNETSDSQEVVPLNERKDSQANETDELTTCETGENKLIKKDDCEIKTSSEIEKFIDSNKCSQFMPVEVNKKTLVLLLDNEPKAVKVRRLTRANTEELEDLFQALEKQLNDRGQQKTSKNDTDKRSESDIEQSKAMSDLAKEIQEFSKREPNKTEQNDKLTQTKEAKETKQEEEFDWGSNPIKYHLKKRTVYLPSTKELEARFRSLERQIKLLEDVEKIDVEQRLTEIERKIKLQYSLSHEKDLNKFLELCEGKDPDEVSALENTHDRKESCSEHKHSSRNSSPNRLKEQSSNIERPHRSLDLKRSKSKQSLKKQPIHPLEMLLDPSPDERDIPTTGELEHRIRVMEDNICTPSPPSRKSRSQSPHKKQAMTRPSIHILEEMTASPTERCLPTAEELEARLEALEREQCFNFKMQKNFQQFNQKLKDAVSPSLSFDEFKTSPKTKDSGQRKSQASPSPKHVKIPNVISPKTIRFCEKEMPQTEIESTPFLENKEAQQLSTVREGLGVMGIRLMRETSPLRRKGTHTGIPLRTGENINDQLTSIQNTIKSIDNLCEEKPYRREKCQQYIDSLFSDSTYFAHKKTSLEDLTSRNLSRSTSREIGPSIKVSDPSPAFSRSMGSADSIHSSSPLRSSSPLQYRSNRDLRREPSPRRRREEDREEHESRVRRDNLLPNNINYSHNSLSHTSHSSLTKFHKVDSQLIANGVEIEHEYEECTRHPTFGTIGDIVYHDNTNTSNNVNTTTQRIFNADVTTPDILNSKNLGRPMLPMNQTFPSTSSTPVYTPAKLEIRHTTVTSTFYDRVLTEKQLEKQHHLFFSTNNQSPMISPQFEKNVKPIYQEKVAKSPTKFFTTDTINKLTMN